VPFGDEEIVPQLGTRSSGNQHFVSFKGRQFTNKGARALTDVARGGRHTGVLPIQLLGSQAILSKQEFCRL
jgi:hypothetical protein